MKFNSIELSNNSRHVHIPHKSFISTLVKNLKLRLVTVSFSLNSTANHRLADSSEYKLLLENMSVLMKEHWPYDTSGDFGTNQIRYLCERFGLEFEQNLSLFRSYLDSEGKYIPAGLVPSINVLKIIPISTAEDERVFFCNEHCFYRSEKFTYHREYQCHSFYKNKRTTYCQV